LEKCLVIEITVHILRVKLQLREQASKGRTSHEEKTIMSVRE
jgi:hypothetical protein